MVKIDRAFGRVFWFLVRISDIGALDLRFVLA